MWVGHVPVTHQYKSFNLNNLIWRRGRDSNPRAGYPTRRFRGAPVTTTSVPLRVGKPSASRGHHAVGVLGNDANTSLYLPDRRVGQRGLGLPDPALLPEK